MKTKFWTLWLQCRWLLPLAVLLGPQSVSRVSAACNYSLSPPSRNHGNGANTNGFNVTNVTAGCAWSVTNNNNWITILSGSSGVGNGAVRYSFTANTNYEGRTGLLYVATQVFELRQSGVSCTYSISPSGTTRGYDAGTGDFDVNPSRTVCPWDVATTNSWITILSSTNGNVGSNTVFYRFDENPLPTWRTGVVMIATTNLFTLIQRGSSCSYSISPTNTVRGHGGSLSNYVTITTTSNCTWAVNNSNDWLTFVPLNGMGPSDVSYAVAANPSALSRTGFVTIATETLRVVQSGAQCNIIISPTNEMHGFESETGQVQVSSIIQGCPWIITNANSWIHFPFGTNGIDNGIVTYVVEANPGGIRSGSFTIDKRTFTVVQEGLICTYDLSPTSRTNGHGATTGTIILTTGSLCDWNIENPNTWVTFTTGLSGTGSRTNVYVLEANPDLNDRTGVIMIGGQPFTLTQRGMVCSYSLSFTNRSHGHGAVSNFIKVTTSGPNCAWTLENTNTWIVFAATNGVGTSNINYTFDANTSMASRTATLILAGEPVTITQQGITCDFRLTPSSETHGGTSETGQIRVATSATCGWTAIASEDWIQITSGAGGTGDGFVFYTLTANPSVFARTGEVAIVDQIFTITQIGNGCTYKLSPTNTMHGHGETTNDVTVTANNDICSWEVVNTNAWIQILSPLQGSGRSNNVYYHVDANPYPVERVAVILIAGLQFKVTQEAYDCEYALSPALRQHGPGATIDDVEVRTTFGCPWSALPMDSWISIATNASGVGSNRVWYSIESNPNPSWRTGSVMIGQQTLTLIQQSNVCSLNISPSNRTNGFGAITGIVSVTSSGGGCPWFVVNSNAWITFPLTNGFGTTTNLTYYLSPNPKTTQRSGTVLIAGRVFNLTQRGTTNGPLFSAIGMLDGGRSRLTLTGPIGGIWELQRSQDLIQWQPIATLTNTTGTVEYQDLPPPGLRCFYRALLQ